MRKLLLVQGRTLTDRTAKRFRSGGYLLREREGVLNLALKIRNTDTWDQAILFALADSAPAEAFPRLGPLLFAANARFGAQGREWMRAALASEHFPSGAAHVDAQAREHFLSGNAHLELNSRRYQAMMNDFAQICRRQNTADALLAYQIA